MSGNATMYQLNPRIPYADVLFTAGLIGQNSPQTPDANHKLLPTLHDFTYDTDFYVSDKAVSQALEFDVSLWMSGITGITFGTQCNYLGDGDWDIWNNAKGQWTSAGVPCKFVDGWNHVTIQVQRQSDNSTLYKSITLNGTTYTLNKAYPPTPSPAGWWGLAVNFQMDSDSKGNQNTAYLDNFSLTYQ